MNGFARQSPIVVGAVGGSGTRVMAQLLMSCGVHLGTDLNMQRDNLLSVLLFDRRTVLSDTNEDFRSLLHLFYRGMTGDVSLNPDEMHRLEDLATKPRVHHAPEFLAERLRMFSDCHGEPEHPIRWGWKMPTTHVFLHRLLEADPSIRYIHLMRHGLDMAFNRNQNQLRSWEPVLLDRSVEMTPQESLSYSCETQSRIRRLSEQYPSNVLLIRFEELCSDPIGVASKSLAFVKHHPPDGALFSFVKTVQAPMSAGSYRSRDLSGFRSKDLEHLEAEGYLID